MKRQIDREATVEERRRHWKQVRYAMRQLTVYRDITGEPAVDLMLRLLDELTSAQPVPAELLDTYHALCAVLMQYSPPDNRVNGWQRYIISSIVRAENAFSLCAEANPAETISPYILDAAARDLAILQQLYDIDDDEIITAIVDSCRAVGIDVEPLIDWNSRAMTAAYDAGLCPALINSAGWGEEIMALARHYADYGTGDFAQYRVFRWESVGGKGHLTGVQTPDPITLDELQELNEQKEQLLRNIEYFTKHLPASNMLLYGKRGTGKSSMIKALANEYSERGLRLIEIPKQHLADLPRIIEQIRPRGFRFILFIDDLSFEEYEVEYKTLKAVLEGGVAAAPENAIICATSNRRHLIREYFSDRKHDEEIHADDTRQEKLSIADRFGMTVLFPTPAQQSYLNIVKALAHKRGIQMGPDELKLRALRWEKSHNGLSGRTARQFVDALYAEIRLDRENL